MADEAENKKPAAKAAPKTTAAKSAAAKGTAKDAAAKPAAKKPAAKTTEAKTTTAKSAGTKSASAKTTASKSSSSEKKAPAKTAAASAAKPAAKKPAAAKTDAAKAPAKTAAKAPATAKADGAAADAKAQESKTPTKAATPASAPRKAAAKPKAGEVVRPQVLKMHHLRPAPGAKTARTRVGRGEASKGKTAGRGTKGTKARYQVRAGLEGGNLNSVMRAPKLRGFTNPFRVEYQVVNLDRLAELYPKGGDVTVSDLVAKGAVRKNEKVKVLGGGDIDVKLNVAVDKVSGSAERKIVAAGGSVQ